MVKNNNMNIVSGKINLMKLLSELELILDFEFHDKNIKNLTCQTKFTHTLYVRLLEKPIIIYVKKDSLPSSIANVTIDKYLKHSIGIERNFDLFYFKTLPLSEIENKEVNCILIENEFENIESLNTLSNIIFFDNFIQKKTGKNNKISNNRDGKINYKIFDEYFSNYNSDEDLLFLRKSRGKHISQYFLGLQLNKSVYKDIEFKYFESPDHIDLENYELKNTTYTFICPICAKKHKIRLYGNKKINVSNYIIASILLNKESNPKYFEFRCDHFQTHYEKQPYPLITNSFQYKSKLTEIEYNKLFIFFASKFKRNENETIDVLVSNDKTDTYEINNYIEIINKRYGKN